MAPDKYSCLCNDECKGTHASVLSIGPLRYKSSLLFQRQRQASSGFVHILANKLILKSGQV